MTAGRARRRRAQRQAELNPTRHHSALQLRAEQRGCGLGSLRHMAGLHEPKRAWHVASKLALHATHVRSTCAGLPAAAQSSLGRQAVSSSSTCRRGHETQVTAMRWQQPPRVRSPAALCCPALPCWLHAWQGAASVGHQPGQRSRRGCWLCCCRRIPGPPAGRGAMHARAVS